MIDVEVSEETKQALFKSLVREHTKAQLQVEKEQEKQTEQVIIFFFFQFRCLEGSAHFWYLLKIIISIKPYLVTSNGKLLIEHFEKRLPLKKRSF